jgi:hypothetical protein
MSYPKKNNKNTTRASKTKIFATAHASFGNPFAITAANFVPKKCARTPPFGFSVQRPLTSLLFYDKRVG